RSHNQQQDLGKVHSLNLAGLICIYVVSNFRCNSCLVATGSKRIHVSNRSSKSRHTTISREEGIFSSTRSRSKCICFGCWLLIQPNVYVVVSNSICLTIW